MKSMNTKLMILLTGFALLGVGCGSSNQFQGATATTPVTGNGNIPGAPTGNGTGTGTGTGSTASNQIAFTPVSFEELGSYVASHRLNNPSDIKLTVDLKDDGAGRYSGQVKISYVDVGQLYTGVFASGSADNQSIKGMYDNGVNESEYNRWYTLNGQSAFAGFFQDQLGAVVLVVDSVVNQGDGQGQGYVSGSVYYKNFAQSYRNGGEATSYRKCWFIRNGPFNCRAESLINKTSVIPDSGYRKLGTFSGLARSASFK